MRERKIGTIGMCYKIMRALAGSVGGILAAAVVMVGTADLVMANVNLTLPVSQAVSVSGAESASPNDVTVTYRLTAEDGAPMPNEASGSEYGFTISGNSRYELAFSYDESGEYSYVLERTAAAGMNGGVIEGNPRKVRIVNAVDSDGLKVTTAIYILEGAEDVGKKMTECSFDYKCTLKTSTVTVKPTSTVTPRSTSTPTVKAASGTGGTNAGSSSKSSSVKTGDESNALLYLAMMVAAVVVLRRTIRDGS